MARRSPFLTTYAAVVVAAALGAYLWFVERKREPGSEEKKKEKVLTLDRAKVRALTLAPTNADEIRLVKDKDQWRMTAPLQVAADGTEVDSALSSLESLEIQDVVSDNPPSVAEYGLDKPKVTVALQQEGRAETRLQIGEKTPDGNALYARTAGQPRVFTVPAYVESSFTKKPFDFRDRDLFHIKRDAVKVLDVTGPEGTYALAREPGGEWAFTKPVASLAGRWSVDGLLGTLEALRMESVAAEEPGDLKAYGLDKPSRRVMLEMMEGEQKALEIGSSAGEKKVYARVSTRPLVAVIPSALLDDLAKGMGELRAKRLLEVATYEVTGFDAEFGGAKRVYARTSSKDKDGIDVHKWKRTAPDQKDLDTNKVQDALFTIGGVEVVEFVDAPQAPATYGLDNPSMKVALRSEGKPPASLELGEKDGAVYARRSGDAAVLKVDPKKAADLLKAFKEL